MRGSGLRALLGLSGPVDGPNPAACCRPFSPTRESTSTPVKLTERPIDHAGSARTDSDGQSAKRGNLGAVAPQSNITNILHNAVQYNRHGGLKYSIRRQPPSRSQVS